MSALAMTLAMSSPTSLIYLVGMILAVAFRRGFPKASLLCLFGLGLLLVATIMQLAMQVLTARYVSGPFPIARSISHFDKIYPMLIIASYVIENMARAVAMALLVGAIFSDRRVKFIKRQENVLEDQADFVKTESCCIARPLSGDAFITSR